HALVCLRHRFSFVFARSAGTFANLVYEVVAQNLEAEGISHSSCKTGIDSIVGSDICQKLVSDRTNRIDAAEAGIQGIRIDFVRNFLRVVVAGIENRQKSKTE